MLNKIRQLSNHPIILLIFGMLILVFVFFFGMPSMGGMGQDGNILSQWSAQINETELSVNEARFYAIRRSSRRNDERTTLKTRIDEMTKEALIDQSAREMQWESTEDDHLKYVASAQNLDSIFFTKDQTQAKDILPAFKQSLGENVDFNEWTTAQLMQSYLTYARKIKGFNGSRLQDFMNNYSMSSQEYLNLKGRELRVRGYLKFLQSQLKSNSDQLRDTFDEKEEAWRFSYVQLGEENVVLDQKPSAKEAIDKLVKDQSDRVKNYYDRNIEKYSKSTVEFTNVTVRYANANQEKEVKKKIEEARARVMKGEDALKVAKSLSTDKITISAFVQSNKSRKNTDRKLFATLLTLKDGDCSEINKRETPSFIQLQGLAASASGTYSFARLKSKKMGEEKSIKDVERQIAQVLIHQDERKKAAQKLAQDMLKAVQAGKVLATEVENYNKTLTVSVPKPANPATTPNTDPNANGNQANPQVPAQETKTLAKVLNLAETGLVKVDNLLNGSIDGLGRSQEASETLLKQLGTLNNTQKAVGQVLEVNQKWTVLVMAEHQESNDVDFEAAEAQLMLDQNKDGLRQFFGGTWLGYELFGPMSNDIFFQFPREIFTIITGEFSSFFSADESFLDQLLASDRYQAMVVKNPSVERYFNQ